MQISKEIRNMEVTGALRGSIFGRVVGKQILSVVGRITASPKVHVLISRTCEDVTLHGKKGFVDVIKLRILR